MKLNVLSAIEIKSPCSEDWDAMPGTDQVRFCQKCGHDVYDLSEMTAQEAARVVANRPARFCVRYEPGRDNLPRFRRGPAWLRSLRQWVRCGFVAAAAALGVILTSAAGCIMGVVVPPERVSQERTATSQSSAPESDAPPIASPDKSPRRKRMGAA